MAWLKFGLLGKLGVVRSFNYAVFSNEKLCLAVASLMKLVAVKSVGGTKTERLAQTI